MKRRSNQNDWSSIHQVSFVTYIRLHHFFLITVLQWLSKSIRQIMSKLLFLSREQEANPDGRTKKELQQKTKVILHSTVYIWNRWSRGRHYKVIHSLCINEPKCDRTFFGFRAAMAHDCLAMTSGVCAESDAKSETKTGIEKRNLALKGNNITLW